MKITGKIIDVHNRKVFSGEIDIKGKKIAGIAETDNVRDVFIMPGLIDAHIHIESSMITPGSFATAARSFLGDFRCSQSNQS